MNKSDMIFGEARENAPPRQYVDPETPVFLPCGLQTDYCASTVTYREACEMHQELGQTLARMMRKRGSATPPDGDVGGTPAAMKVAA